MIETSQMGLDLHVPLRRQSFQLFSGTKTARMMTFPERHLCSPHKYRTQIFPLNGGLIGASAR
jgi:hypothetical protein